MMEKDTQGMAFVPKDTVVRSDEKKRKSRRLSQIPVYRDLSNLKYNCAVLMKRCPRNMVKMLDGVLATATEAKKSVGMAWQCRDARAKADYIAFAIALTQDIHDDMHILTLLNVSDKDTENKMKSLAKKIVAQLTAWRDYEHGQGVGTEQ